MKILQLTNKIPFPPRDGGAIATLNISLGLQALGHDITILGMNTSKHYTDLSKLPDYISNSIDIREVKTHTHINFADAFINLLFSRLPYTGTRFFTEEYSRILVKLLNEKNFDVVQIEGLYMCYYIPLIKKHSKALVAFRAHNLEHEIWERVANQDSSFLRKIYLKNLSLRIKRFKNQILNTYDLLIPITQRDALIFEQMGNIRPICVIPAGLDKEKFLNYHGNKISPNVFFIGTLDWFPNQEGLVWFIDHVWDKIIEKHKEIEFHVAGRNAPEWLRKMLESKPGVFFHGEVDDAAEFMQKSAIMIAPLFSGSGMRVKVIEGMAMGKAIITTSVGAEGIPVENGKNIFIEDEPYNFAVKLNHLIENKKLFDDIGKNAVKFVAENFDNHKISSKLADFYQSHLS
ncbi:MAG: glycosyltransferase [Bacteroidetes bacterium]|nr:MAG: glycosyltransferase [Bacteroidota bacterium]